jgi:hypothetical protein
MDLLLGLAEVVIGFVLIIALSALIGKTAERLSGRK